MAVVAAPAAPARAGAVLATLIAGAVVANINLSTANVALPDIGRAFSASQTWLNLVAIGCTLGLAMSVLYLGALGDRYGRRLLLMLGMTLTIPASIASAWAPTVEILVAGRVITGIAAGLAYPTTLSLITALWGPGRPRVRAIALWSSLSGAGAVLGPVIGGALLERFWWGSVFLIAVVPAFIVLLLVVMLVPSGVNQSQEPVDHLGGVISVLMVGALVLGVATVASPTGLSQALILIAVSAGLAVLFVLRERSARNPLYNLRVASRRLFWVPAIAGMIVFGSLMGGMFIGQQFMQNVLGYSTLASGVAVIPAAVGMVLVAGLAARLTLGIGTRATMLLGYAFILPAFLVMLLAWREQTAAVWVGLAYLLIGCGAGLALAPAARSLTSSVTIARVGMASATNDLQRDLGGAIMQALMGSLLTAGYAATMAAAIGTSAEASKVTQQTSAALQDSFASAATLAERYPTFTQEIIAAARDSFLAGANWAYAAGAVAVVLGALLVATCYPGRTRERRLLDSYAAAESTASESTATGPG